MPGGRVGPPVRGEVYLVNFDPTLGAEIRKTRPALILQNDIANEHSPITIVAAITSKFDDQLYPHRGPAKGSGGRAQFRFCRLAESDPLDRPTPIGEADGQAPDLHDDAGRQRTADQLGDDRALSPHPTSGVTTDSGAATHLSTNMRRSMPFRAQRRQGSVPPRAREAGPTAASSSLCCYLWYLITHADAH